MGWTDRLKGLITGREQHVKRGIDTVSNRVEQAVGPKHAAKLDDLSHKAKAAVDKLGADEETSSAPSTASSTAPSPPAAAPSTPPPATPSSATPPTGATPPEAPAP